LAIGFDLGVMEDSMPSLFLKIGLLAMTVPVAAPPQNAAVPAELRKLHVLMVFDTTDVDLAPSLKIDEWRMRRCLKLSIPADRYQVTLLKGKDVTPERIFDYYRNLKPDARDGLLFFYGGHGATDTNTKLHFLDLACGKPLVRADLRKAMEAKKTDLVLLLTDCCSTPQKISKLTAQRRVQESRDSRAIHPTVRCLLFQARGTIDVTAATNNASWSDNEKGGLFTRSLCRMLTENVKSLDTDRDGFVSWQEFFPQLQKETQITFHGWSRVLLARGEKINTTTQKPASFALGDQVVPGSQSYAVVGIENRTEGPLIYRWRWSGQQEWNNERLEPGTKKVHALPLSNGQQAVPDFEAEIKGKKASALRAGKWTGKGSPSFEDGESYCIQSRKK
jgi:Caspase domain